MKKIIATVVISLGLATTICAQEKNKQVTPTKEAKAAFEKQFAGSTDVKWEKENGDLEVNFKQTGTKMSVLYTSSGVIKEIETEMPVADLPAQATTYIKQHYAGAKVKGATKIEKTDGTIMYEAEINKKDVLFDSAGNFIKEAMD